MKNKIEKAFKICYPNKRLLASKINDFYITIGFDDGKRDSEVQQEAFFFGDKRYTDGNMETLRNIVGVGAYTYGHDCGTHTWVKPEQR